MYNNPEYIIKMLLTFEQHLSKLHKEAAGNNMEEYIKVDLMSNAYLQTYKYKLAQAEVVYITIFDIILFIMNNLMSGLGSLRISFTLVVLCAVSYFTWLKISRNFDNITSKLLPSTMSSEQQDKYQCKQKRVIAFTISVMFFLSAIYFIAESVYHQHIMNTLDDIVSDGVNRFGQEAIDSTQQILVNTDNNVSWNYLFILFVFALFCVGSLLCFFINCYNIHRLTSFRFSSNAINRNYVRNDGVELMQNGNCITKFDLSKNKLFFENFGMLLVYHTDTEIFEVFSNAEFDSVLLRKNDSTVFGELKFNSKWQFF